MKGLPLINQLRDAVTKLDPSEVRAAAGIPVSIELVATNEEVYRAMERFFTPDGMTAGKRAEGREVVRRDSAKAGGATLQIYDPSLPHQPSPTVFTWNPADPQKTVRDILTRRPELNLALARRLHPFREPVSTDIIRNVAKENALFSLATAVPYILPLISLPWAVGEFASDTAFLTLNQVRMAFLLAAANDRKIGFREQKAEVGSLVASAFGWRAIARELIGKIPYGGGLIPKAAVAYAGTYVAGASIERFYRLGYGMTEAERKAAYERAYERGKDVAGALLQSYKSRSAS